MGLFGQFTVWIDALLANYVAANTAIVAQALEPAFVTLATIYVMVWGYLHLTGQVQEAFVTGVKRLATLAVILGVGLQLWLYNTLIVDTFFNGPGELSSAIVGAGNPVNVVDQIMFSGGDAANLLLSKGGIFNGLSYTLAGVFVYLVVGLTAVYTVFLLTLAHIALSVLLALGPLFIMLLLFDATKRFFEAWIAQLANYGFIAVLTVLLAALMLHLLTVASQQAVAQGGGIGVADAVRVCLAAGLTFLVMRQVMPMAAGLASGLALSSFGVLSAALAWGLGRASRGVGQFGRGLLLDRETTRWDSLSRKAGYYLGRGVTSGAQRLLPRRENSIQS